MENISEATQREVRVIGHALFGFGFAAIAIAYAAVLNEYYLFGMSAALLAMAAFGLADMISLDDKSSTYVVTQEDELDAGITISCLVLGALLLFCAVMNEIINAFNFTKRNVAVVLVVAAAWWLVTRKPKRPHN